MPEVLSVFGGSRLVHYPPRNAAREGEELTGGLSKIIEKIEAVAKYNITTINND